MFVLLDLLFIVGLFGLLSCCLVWFLVIYFGWLDLIVNLHCALLIVGCFV